MSSFFDSELSVEDFEDSSNDLLFFKSRMSAIGCLADENRGYGAIFEIEEARDQKQSEREDTMARTLGLDTNSLSFRKKKAEAVKKRQEGVAEGSSQGSKRNADSLQELLSELPPVFNPAELKTSENDLALFRKQMETIEALQNSNNVSRASGPLAKKLKRDSPEPLDPLWQQQPGSALEGGGRMTRSKTRKTR